MACRFIGFDYFGVSRGCGYCGNAWLVFQVYLR